MSESTGRTGRPARRGLAEVGTRARRSIGAWANRGGPIEQAERAVTVLFALVRGAQGVQVLFLLRVPLNAGTTRVAVAVVAIALTAQTIFMIARALAQGRYGGRRTAWCDVAFMVCLFAATYTFTPIQQQIEAGSWLFSPAIALICGAALGLRLREALLAAVILDVAYSWGYLTAPDNTSPIIFNLGSITAFPVLTVITAVGAGFIRNTGQRLQEADERNAVLTAQAVRLEERGRQGRFLHDSVIQVLEGVHQYLRLQTPSLLQSELTSEATRAARQCRLYLEGKDPLSTDSVALLLAELEPFTDSLGLQLRVVDERESGDDDPDSLGLTALNLCVRECLRNIRKHTSVRAVTLRVAQNGTSLELRVGRGGPGYDPTRISPMKYVDLLEVGGSVVIDTQPEGNYGERVILCLPHVSQRG